MTSGEIVAASLEALAERVGDPARQVYARLFAEHPDMEALFVRDTTGAVRGEMLAMAFECLLDIGGSGAYAANLIAAERVNHQGVGVPPEAFGPVLPDPGADLPRALGRGLDRRGRRGLGGVAGADRRAHPDLIGRRGSSPRGAARLRRSASTEEAFSDAPQAGRKLGQVRGCPAAT